jgi:hypothetical protein
MWGALSGAGRNGDYRVFATDCTNMHHQRFNLDMDSVRLLHAWRSGWSPFSGVKLAGFEVVISELETELDYLRRATRYLEE